MIDTEDNLERQLEEFEALRSILGTHCVAVKSSTPNNLLVQLLAHSPDASLVATLSMTLSTEYPSHGPPLQIGVVTNTPGFDHCTDVFAEIWADAEGEVCMYEMIQWLNERLADVEEDNKHLAEEEKKLHQQEQELLLLQHQQTTTNNSYVPTQFGRRCIYSHHIIANSKRTAVIRTALHLRLSGISKIGWPGVIVVEGDELGCQEYVRYLSSLRWKQLTVRGEEVIEIGQGENVDSLRRFPKGMEEFGEKSMKEAAAACRAVGLEDLFLTSMKIYKKD